MIGAMCDGQGQPLPSVLPSAAPCTLVAHVPSLPSSPPLPWWDKPVGVMTVT